MVLLLASVAQCATSSYSLEPTLEKLERLVKLAKERDGSQLVVFPEAFIGGYPKHSTFGAPVGSRTKEGREEWLRYHQAAISIPSPATDRIAAIATENDVFLVVGIIEKEGGTLYCSVAFFEPKKGLVYKRRKLMPTGAERLIWGFGDEKTLEVVKAEFVSSTTTTTETETETETKVEEPVTAVLSGTICWENYMPLLRNHWYKQGVQIYCAPTVDSRESWESTMRHIAQEGRCFVLSACQFAQQKDYPPTQPIGPNEVRDPEGIMIAGGSMIVGPLGEVLAGPLRGEEGILTATLDLDDILRGKYDLDVTGHYARNDIFEFGVKGFGK